MPDEGRFLGSSPGWGDGLSQRQSLAVDVDTALVDVGVERALLGALLTNSGLVAHMPPGFTADHYGHPLHGEVHRHIVELSHVGAGVTLDVINAMGARDEETRKYVAGLLGCMVGNSKNFVRGYAEAVIDMHRRRGLYRAAAEMQEAALGPRNEMTATALIGRAMSQMDALIAGDTSEGGPVTLDDSMDAALASMERARNGQVTGISTGFRSVDDTIGSLDAGNMVVVAARPGMGKTGLGLQIAIEAARSGEPVLMISLEMNAQELARRAICAVADLPINLAKKGRIGRQDWDRTVQARRELGGLPFLIEDAAGQTAGMIALKARAARRRFKRLGLIVVDHMHIVRPDSADAKNGASWAVGRISGAMKRLAKDNECPALILAQLNRGVEGRDDKRPSLADLRQAGEIEQDADIVAFLYRAEYYLSKQPERSESESADAFATRVSRFNDALDAARGKAELIFAKVRDGEPGTIPLLFNGPTTSFSEPDQHG